jgi:hypothetical protein
VSRLQPVSPRKQSPKGYTPAREPEKLAIPRRPKRNACPCFSSSGLRRRTLTPFFDHSPFFRSLPGTCSPDLFELSMQGLNFKSEYWLQFVETFGDIHPSMQHSQNKNGIPLDVANKKVPIDAMEVQRLMKIRFFSQHFRVVRNSLQCSLDLIKVIIGNSITPGPDAVFLNGDQVLQSLIG